MCGCFAAEGIKYTWYLTRKSICCVQRTSLVVYLQSCRESEEVTRYFAQALIDPGAVAAVVSVRCTSLGVSRLV